ncbi:MAG: LPS export ABC transporter ATP-binding protein [Candidatus Aminicenantia bacterium]
MILSASNLSKSFGKRRVLNNVSIEVKTGEIVGLLGPNGAGKTTTFSILLGLFPPDEGKVELDGEDITYTPMYRRAHKGIGFLPQEPSIFRGLTVEENLFAVLESIKIPYSEKKRKLGYFLKIFSIEHLRNVKGYLLSGGERRRAEVARALILEPKFLLLDEPFTGIDPISVSDFQKIILSLKEKGIGILITDHNVRETLKITDKAYIIKDGAILREGTPVMLASDPEVRKGYLGEKLEI